MTAKLSPLLLLVGLPGSGKSTWASHFVALHPDYRIVSTDAIRADLYGNAAIQGEWTQVWHDVLQSWQVGLAAIAAGQLTGIIYDATNVRRRQRRLVIDTARTLGFSPIAIYWFDTPLERCLWRNQRRPRQVPEEVISRMARQLQGAPPSLEEGIDVLLRIWG